MSTDIAENMDKQYRYQRYVYDFSRKYYLFGRDAVLTEIPFMADDNLLEVGCGTARNLLKVAYRRPATNLYGLDVSAAMLDSARNKVDKTLYAKNIHLKHGYAQQVTASDFGLDEGFDHVLFSYVLSMIPDWQSAVEQAIANLKPGGYLHIVDFSDQQAMPAWFRSGLLQWLEWFHVKPEPALPIYLKTLESRYGGELRMRHLSGRYALIAHYQKEGNPNDDESDPPQIPQYLDF